MSLFPAYAGENQSDIAAEDQTNAPKWLTNNSFIVNTEELRKDDINKKQVDDDSNRASSFDDDEIKSVTSSDSESSYDSNSKKKVKNRRKYSSDVITPESAKKFFLDFHGNEEFYVDKSRAVTYNSVRKLYKPACPYYKINYTKILGLNSGHCRRKKFKRYYRSRRLRYDSIPCELFALSEDEYTTKMGALNRRTIEACRELQPWIDLVELQDRNPYKWSRLRIADKKLDYLEKALKYHPQNDKLYELYVRTVTTTYSSHDVAKLLESLLCKDRHSFTLWKALIMNTQTTLARCTVPEVLQLYKRCMKYMQNAQRLEVAARHYISDIEMLDLFHNCALFLRQAGLNEQFFAMVKLLLEINTCNATKLCAGLEPLPDDDSSLIEYEELILKSILPINEIWLRIEKLRQSYCFLPFPGDSDKCSDPQRIIYNEDVCNYVYPLKDKESTFHLLLIITKLLKIPFIQTDCLAGYFQPNSISDAIEELLIVYLNPSYALSTLCQKNCKQFESNFYELIKELTTTPTFLNHTIAHELYERCLRDYLLNSAELYENSKGDNWKRFAFLMIWCRFERLLLILYKLSKKITMEIIKSGRTRFRSVIKQQINQNSILLYVEYALYELESGSDQEIIEDIFKKIIPAYDCNINSPSELCYAYVTYAEILLSWNKIEEASQLLSNYILGLPIRSDDQLLNCNARMLSALKSLHDKLDIITANEENIEKMSLEQYIIPDHYILLIKIYVIFQYTLKQKKQSLKYLDNLLEKFHKDMKKPRHCFLREMIQEIYVIIMQLPDDKNLLSPKYIEQHILDFIQEYPNNIFLLKSWSILTSTAWYKLRGGFLKINPSIVSVLFLITLARCRFINIIESTNRNHKKKGDMENENNNDDGKDEEVDQLSLLIQIMPVDLHYHEMMARQRILNLFNTLLSGNSIKENKNNKNIQVNNVLQQNSLFWRCYLRCLSDQNISFELVKTCLLNALDSCPSSKALYLDGATYVPQELPQLQDLIIEKQLRIYTLPEELEILRH